MGAEKNGTLDDGLPDPNAVKLNGVDLSVPDDINTNHVQPMYNRNIGLGNTAQYYNNNSNNNKNGNAKNNQTKNVGGDVNNVSSIGFLSRMSKKKPKKSSPPALVKVTDEMKDDPLEDNDSHVEY